MMNRKFKVVLGAMCGLVCGLCLVNQALSETLPDGKGKAEFVHNCTACHRADMVTRVKKTPDDWRKSVDDMAARGTDGTKEDLDNVVLYLDTNFAIDKSGSTGDKSGSTEAAQPAAAQPAAAQPITPSSTAGGPAALNPSEIEHAKNIIADNGCLICHRMEQQGAYTGPTLNGVGARRTTTEIRTAIVSPPPTLDPNNNLVRLTTADGKTITGRILSQDDHQVRVIHPSGEVATYAKPELHQFTVINVNPMPSYERKITGDDLDDLVRYLGSLPPVDESASR